MSFHWYYLQIHFFRVGSAARQLRAFLFFFFPHNPCGKAWAHPLAGRWSLVEALLSQPSVSKPSVSSRMDFYSSVTGAAREALIFFPPRHLAGLFIVGLGERSGFLGSICPPGPRTAARGVSWWLWGNWGEHSLAGKGGETKRGRGPAQRGLGSRHVRVCSSPKLSLSSKSRNKRFSLSLIFLWKMAVKELGPFFFYSRAACVSGDLHLL